MKRWTGAWTCSMWVMATLLGVAVIAASAEAKGNKVAICHVPPGNPDNAHTITVSENAVPAHLAHGDALDACPSGCLLDTSFCDDENFCTNDVCLANGECAHQPVDCDDSDICTQDLCIETQGCVYTPADGLVCDDGNVCTSPDACQGGSCMGADRPGCCLSDGDCIDASLCTTDICGANNTCVNEDVDCSIQDQCFTGFCDPTDGSCGTVPLNCDDGNVCTDDLCDASTGCFSVPTSTPPEPSEVTCDDGVDNDCDGLPDSADPDCDAPTCEDVCEQEAAAVFQGCLEEGGDEAGCAAEALEFYEECVRIECPPQGSP